jgi:K+/H+ antiporter YhaU regulatory subunit KhtT
MKVRLILLIILTLAVGFFLGWLTSTQVRLHRLQPFRVFLSDDRFREGFYKTIQPDEKQKQELDKILDKYARINSEFQMNIRKDIDSNMKAFRKELDSKLTEDQISRLKEMEERRQEMIRQSMKRRGDSTFVRQMRPGGPGHSFQRRPFHDEMQGPPPPPPMPPSDSTGGDK